MPLLFIVPDTLFDFLKFLFQWYWDLRTVSCITVNDLNESYLIMVKVRCASIFHLNGFYLIMYMYLLADVIIDVNWWKIDIKEDIFICKWLYFLLSHAVQ